MPVFNEIHSSIRNDLIPFFQVLELKPKELLIKEETKDVSIYALISGRLKKSVHPPWASYREEEDLREKDIITLMENFAELRPFNVFGNLNLFDPIKS